MERMTDGGSIVDAVRNSAISMSGSGSDLDGLLDMVGNACYVLIGEASQRNA